MSPLVLVLSVNPSFVHQYILILEAQAMLYFNDHLHLVYGEGFFLLSILYTSASANPHHIAHTVFTYF
jgi:hypothetical protein